MDQKPEKTVDSKKENLVPVIKQPPWYPVLSVSDAIDEAIDDIFDNP